MAASISPALARVKLDLSERLPEQLIVDAARAVGHRWRKRIFDPVMTVHLFVFQILNFNTSLTHLRHLAGFAVKPSAFCQARMRLPLAVMTQLLSRMYEAVRSGADAGSAGSCFCGHRVVLLDGSSSSAPDTKGLQNVFPQSRRQRKGCGFPMIKLLGLFDAGSGLLIEMLTASLHAHEQSQVRGLHPLLHIGDLLLGDRGFCSFWHVALLSAAQVFSCFRMHQHPIVNFRPHRRHRDRKAKGNRQGKGKRKYNKGRPTSIWVRRLGKHDQVVRWTRPLGSSRPKWMSVEQYAQMPDSVDVREIRYPIPRKGQRTLCVTIATTLLDPLRYPKDPIARLYKLRWEVEICHSYCLHCHTFDESFGQDLGRVRSAA